MSKEINLFIPEEEKIVESIEETEATEVCEAAEPPSPSPLQTALDDGDLEEMIDRLKLQKEQQQLASNQELNKKKIMQMIEALLFSSRDPVSFNKIREIADEIQPLKPRDLKTAIEDLQHEYITQDRAFRLIEIGNGYILRTNEEFSHYVNLLYRDKRVEKLSPAATETLAIIAYKQPITRPQIEAIRGVDTTGTVINLLERGLVEAVGKLEAPGRPMLFATTTEFLKYFGIKELSELPKI